jgi:hypothetical protein
MGVVAAVVTESAGSTTSTVTVGNATKKGDEKPDPNERTFPATTELEPVAFRTKAARKTEVRAETPGVTAPLSTATVPSAHVVAVDPVEVAELLATIPVLLVHALPNDNTIVVVGRTHRSSGYMRLTELTQVT